jgi:hypothetical protein
LGFHGRAGLEPPSQSGVFKNLAKRGFKTSPRDFVNGWINENERYLAKIQSVALDLDILYGLLVYKKSEDIQVNRSPDKRVR